MTQRHNLGAVVAGTTGLLAVAAALAVGHLVADGQVRLVVPQYDFADLLTVAIAEI